MSNNTINVSATDDPGPALNTVLNGTNPVPDGIKNVDTWFTPADLGSHSNSAEVLLPKTGRNKTNQAVVKITEVGNSDTFGAIWSKRDQTDSSNNNYLDISKHQTMSMWLYFGGVAKANQTAGGDGMAFVLQNSTAGTNAFNNDSVTGNGIGDGAGGQTLGVWGPVVDSRVLSTFHQHNTPQILANRAIQNSWALEFDTFHNAPMSNENKDKNSNFDEDTSTINHIASNFPASPNTYDFSASDVDTYGPKMNHLGLIERKDKRNFLSDGAWHHLTMTWLPAGTNNGSSGQD